jgi:hypothetical protein
MSAVRILLDSLVPQHAPWTADERGIYVLTVLPDVVVNLEDQPTTEQVRMFSAAGRLGPEDDFEGDIAMTTTSSEGKVALWIAEPSGLVVAQRALECRRLDARAFVEELSSHVRLTREVAASLPPERAELDEDVGSDSTWRLLALVGE